jgi:hypothetical protein
MCLYVYVKKIIAYVTTKYKDAKIKEFKNVLTLMLNSFSTLTSILNNNRKIIKFTKENFDIQYKKEIYQGILCDVEYCDYCHKKFEFCKKDKIIVYLCGHKLHLNCVGENNDECIVCLNYFPNTNTNKKENKTKKNKKFNIIKKEEEIDLGSENLNELAGKIEPNKLNLILLKAQRLNKLKKYEKKYNEKNSLFT